MIFCILVPLDFTLPGTLLYRIPNRRNKYAHPLLKNLSAILLTSHVFMMVVKDTCHGPIVKNQLSETQA